MAFSEFYFNLSQLILCNRRYACKKPLPKTPAFEAFFFTAEAAKTSAEYQLCIIHPSFFFTCLQLNVGQQSRHTASKECSTHMQNPAKEQKGPLFTHFIGSLLTLAARPAGYQKNFRRYGTTARPGELCLCFFLSNGPRNIIVAPCPRKCDRSHSNGPLPNFLLCCLKTMIFPFFFFLPK